MKKTILIVLVAQALLAHGQLVQVPINAGHINQSKKHSTSARVQSGTPLTLPFWDDFSFTQEEGFPNDTLWSSSRSVWVNNGIGINPPSIFTAAFDGIDSTGNPYNIVDPLAKGFADKLISRNIDLSTLPASQNDSVYLSFFFEVTGNREAPDQDDNFSLWFKDVNGTWEKVFEVGDSISIDPATFYYKNIKVDAKYFYNSFQFKFQNFARLSGPYDTWSLDYIYLNQRRAASDIYFHDQTQTKPPSSIFKKYRSIPMKHFKDTASSVLISPIAGFYNLYKFSAQSFKYTSSARVVDREDGIINDQSFIIELNGDAQTVLPKFTHFDLELAQTIPLSSLNLSADSIYIDFKLGFDSGDKNIVPETPLFYPINFTYNDTTHTEFILSKHYAYDDGTAEYGAGLNQPGSQTAYGFDMLTKEPDTVVSVDIYWPKFGDESNRTVILKIWSARDGMPGSEIYGQTITIERTTNNQFTRYMLTDSIGVKGKFFIGWEQTTAGVIPVGLDKNTNSGDEIYSNISGSWEQNQIVDGSLMIRPIFGKGQPSVITAINDSENPSLFPNPNFGEFYLPDKAQYININNIYGCSINYTIEQSKNTQLVRLVDAAPGIYIVRWREGVLLFTARALVRN